MKFNFDDNSMVNEDLVLKEDSLDQCRSDANSICKMLDRNNIWYELVDYDMYPMNTSKVSFEVSGDWKHDHWAFKEVLGEWAEENDRDIFKIDEEEIGESDSDNYTARYDVFITADKDSYDRLNSMRGLFAEGLNPREKQIYVDAVNEAEDIEDLEDICHEIYFYDKRLFAQINKRPKDGDVEKMRANMLKYLQESIKESKMFGSNYRYDIVWYNKEGKRITFGFTNDINDAENIAIRACKHIYGMSPSNDRVQFLDSLDIEDTDNKNVSAITSRVVDVKKKFLSKLEDKNESLEESRALNYVVEPHKIDMGVYDIVFCKDHPHAGERAHSKRFDSYDDALNFIKRNARYNNWVASPINEDTIKTKDGKWTNKGDEGTHGKFNTKKEADAQRKAMFANGFHEDLADKFLRIHDGDEYNWNLHNTDYTRFYDILKRYMKPGETWDEKDEEGYPLDSNVKLDTLFRRMPKSEQRKFMKEFDLHGAYDESLKESIHDWPVVIDNTNIQLPISENELIYFIETNFLKNKYNIDFIDEVKLVTSGVDEANRKYYDLKVSGFLRRVNKMFKVPVRVWENGDIEDSRKPLPPVENVIDESLNESAAMDSAQKLEDDGWTVLSNGIRGGDMKHYWLARRMNKERGKADWKAIDDETGNVMDISYDQALGREPIGVSSGISKLSKQLGKRLLPNNESLKEDSDTTNDLNILKSYLPSDIDYRQHYGRIVVQKDIDSFIDALIKYGWTKETSNYVGSEVFSKNDLTINVWSSESPRVCYVKLLLDEGAVSSRNNKSLKEDFSDFNLINYNDFLANNFDGWSDDIDDLMKEISKCARALKTVSNKLIFYVDYDEDFYAVDNIAKVVEYIDYDYSLYQLNDLSGIYFVFGSDNLWIFRNEKEANYVISQVKAAAKEMNESLQAKLDEGLLDSLEDFKEARKNWKKVVKDISFDVALERWNKESELADPDWFAKPIYSVKAWNDMVNMFSNQDDLEEAPIEEDFNYDPDKLPDLDDIDKMEWKVDEEDGSEFIKIDEINKSVWVALGDNGYYTFLYDGNSNSITPLDDYIDSEEDAKASAKEFLKDYVEGFY